MGWRTVRYEAFEGKKKKAYATKTRGWHIYVKIEKDWKKKNIVSTGTFVISSMRRLGQDIRVYRIQEWR